MRTKVVAVALVMALASGLPVAAASGATGGVMGCPGLVEVEGGWLLTQDVSGCWFNWSQDDTTLDLGGHSYTGAVEPWGDGQTLRNGTLVIDFDWWASASNFTVSHVTVQSSPTSTCTNFCIEAGEMTIEHSVFRDFPAIALDFYFGSYGTTIHHSTFIGNGAAISIQGDSGLTIENNWFVDNDIGVNLWTEDAWGVNDITIGRNVFLANRTGVRVSADDWDPWRNELLSRNTVRANWFVGNDTSGLHLAGHCYPAGPSCDLAVDNVIDANLFWRNGFEPYPTRPAVDDGMTARGFDHADHEPATESPAVLAGFTVTRNLALQNADLGFDVPGVTDGRGNRAWANGNPTQCVGVDCRIRPRPRLRADAGAAAVLPPGPPPDQVRHDPSTLPG